MHHRSLRSAFGSAAALAMAVALATGGSLVTAPATRAADFPSYDSRYHTYAEMVAEIMAAQTAHPDIVKISSIGKSYQGRDHLGWPRSRTTWPSTRTSPRSCSTGSTTLASTSRSSRRWRSCAG